MGIGVTPDHRCGQNSTLNKLRYIRRTAPRDDHNGTGDHGDTTQLTADSDKATLNRLAFKDFDTVSQDDVDNLCDSEDSSEPVDCEPDECVSSLSQIKDRGTVSQPGSAEK